MSQFKLHVKEIFDGVKTRYNKTVSIENGTILSIGEAHDIDKCLSGLLVPGFIDVQVNGGGGCLFNEAPCVESIKTIGRAHFTYGTTGWLPTLVTDSFDKMVLAADAVAASRKQNAAGVLGVHFEGPCLSVARKGVHSENHIRRLSHQEMDVLQRNDLGKVVVTVAPENISPSQIETLVKDGVIVSLGHSNATFEQTSLALQAGATGFTHLFNAMSQLTPREPGLVGAALSDENSFAGVIVDGVHVHYETLKLAMKLKTNLMLVTDAMPPVGSDKESFEFFGQSILRKNNTLTDNSGRLAGSVLDMITAVNNCVEFLELSLFDAINFASRNPASFLGLKDKYGGLAIGMKASMILLDKDNKVSASWIDGEKVI